MTFFVCLIYHDYVDKNIRKEKFYWPIKIELIMNKSQIVLYIYDLLINHIPFTKQEIVNEFKINERTFRRYIADINCYFCDCFKPFVVIYNYETGIYSLGER